MSMSSTPEEKKQGRIDMVVLVKTELWNGKENARRDRSVDVAEVEAAKGDADPVQGAVNATVVTATSETALGTEPVTAMPRHLTPKSSMVPQNRKLKEHPTQRPHAKEDAGAVTATINDVAAGAGIANGESMSVETGIMTVIGERAIAEPRSLLQMTTWFQTSRSKRSQWTQWSPVKTVLITRNIMRNTMRNIIKGITLIMGTVIMIMRRLMIMKMKRVLIVSLNSCESAVATFPFIMIFFCLSVDFFFACIMLFHPSFLSCWNFFSCMQVLSNLIKCS